LGLVWHCVFVGMDVQGVEGVSLLVNYVVLVS